MSEWQEIITAPRDWSDVIVYVPDLESDHRKVCEAYFDREELAWFAPAFGRIIPTRWMPFPQPPAT